MNRHPKDRSKRAAARRGLPVVNAPSARQKYEKYLALARAEDGNGDPVAAENYYQHAEHYFRAFKESATDTSVNS